MGFRSTFTSSGYNIKWPDWFTEKYENHVNIQDGGCISSKYEAKLYMASHIGELAEDVQKVITTDKPQGFCKGFEFILMFMHECDGVSRCHITPEYIKWSEPIGWRWEDDTTHNYCYGCSKPKEGE